MRPNDFRPEVQARRAAYARDPEHQRRRSMWMAARGRKRALITMWNNENARGIPGAELDFPAWLALRRSQGASDYLGKAL